MKSQVKRVLLGLLIASTQLNAQSLAGEVDPKQISIGTWPCKVAFSGNGGKYEANTNAKYYKHGLSTHNDEATFRAADGRTIKLYTIASGRWRYDVASQRLYETLSKVDVTYDKKNPLANTIGALYLKSYKSAIGSEQVSYTTLLNDKKWSAVIGDSKTLIVNVNCQRS